MSWSTSYSSKQSIVIDSYHRVAVRHVLSDLLAQGEEKVFSSCHLYAHNHILHQYVLIDQKAIISLAAGMQLIDKLVKASALVNKGISGTFLSVVCPMALYHTVSPLITFPIDVLYISLPKTHHIVKNADVMDALLAEIAESKLIRAVGVADCQSVDDIDAFMLTHKHHAKLRFLSLHLSSLPNLATMIMELAHSFGWNCLVTLDPSLLPSSYQHTTYTELATAYEVSPFVVIFKCLLQLGALLAFPALEMEGLVEDLPAQIGRLGHPFVHRKEFVAPTQIISLLISDEDLDRVLELSETEEVKRDQCRFAMATTAPSSLDCQYIASNL